MLKIESLQAYQKLACEKPVEYARHVLGIELWAKQREIIKLAADPSVSYISVKSGNGVGKTYLTASIICQYLDTHYPGYAIISSSSWTQVLKTVWPTLRKVIRNAKANLGGDVLKTEWQRGDHWGAFCVSPDEPENFSGFRTSGGCLVIVDEASALDQRVHEAIMGLASAKGSKVIYLGNPLYPDGPFYDTFHSPDWANVHISSTEVVDLGIPGLATHDWLDARKREWGTDTPMYRSRVLGDFPESMAHSIIKLEWLSRVIVPKKLRPSGIRRMGVDIARYGDDRTVAIIRDDRCVIDVHVTENKSTMETVAMIQDLAAEYSVDEDQIFVDDTGLGGGVTDRLHELDVDVIPVNFGSKAIQNDKFKNTRAELYWLMRETMCEDAENRLYIPKQYANLAKELTWTTYKQMSDQRIQLESKENIKKQRKASPDLADALALTFAGREDIGFGADAA